MKPNSRRQKIGEWILDIAKYLVTIGILAPIFNLGEDYSPYYYFVVGIIASILTWLGLELYGPQRNKKNKSDKRNKRR